MSFSNTVKQSVTHHPVINILTPCVKLLLPVNIPSDPAMPSSSLSDSVLGSLAGESSWSSGKDLLVPADVRGLAELVPSFTSLLSSSDLIEDVRNGSNPLDSKIDRVADAV